MVRRRLLPTFIRLAPTPLVTRRKRLVRRVGTRGPGPALTADGRRGPEGARDVRVEVDEDVLRLHELRVPRLDPLLHKVRERVADDAVDDVDDPLLRELLDLPLRGQVPHHLRVQAGEVEDDLEGKRLVVGHAQVPELLARQDWCKVSAGRVGGLTLLDAGGALLEEVDGDVGHGRQVLLGLDGEEVVDLALALVLGAELGHADLLEPVLGNLVGLHDLRFF